MTQEELAMRVDVAHSAVVLWERGDREPSLRMVQRLETALGLEPGAFLKAIAEGNSPLDLLPEDDLAPLSLYFDIERVSPHRVAQAIHLLSDALGHEIKIVGTNTLPPGHTKLKRVV